MASKPVAPMVRVSPCASRIIHSLSLWPDTFGGMTMDQNMEQFIHRENIAHYRRLLAEPNVASDPVRHKLIIRLLADREAKDAIPHGQ
jgi:hypothetical protein